MRRLVGVFYLLRYDFKKKGLVKSWPFSSCLVFRSELTRNLGSDVKGGNSFIDLMFSTAGGKEEQLRYQIDCPKKNLQALPMPEVESTLAKIPDSGGNRA
jgi:hypothetical protein